MFDELREMNNEIRKRQEWIATLRARATSMTKPYTSDRVQSSAGDSLGDIMCKIMTLEEELNTIIDTYADRKNDVKNLILSINNEEWQDILFMRCLEFKTFREIAFIQGTTLNAVKQKHKRATKYIKKHLTDT